MRSPAKAAITTAIALSVIMPATPAFADEWKEPPTSFNFAGAGWGHGVGMSQYGARGMAQSGKSANQILEHYYNPAKISQDTAYANSDIRVQVLSASTASMSVTGGTARIRDGASTRTAKSSMSYQIVGGKLRYTVDDKTYTTSNKITVQWEGTEAWKSNRKAILSVQRANDGWGAVAYRHGFMTVGSLNNKVNIVNQLRLNDEYLYGLAEVPSSWEPAALQSQAIAGRTYAMRNMGNLKSSCDCNVYDEVASQKFTAWNKENEANGVIGARWKAAVDNTLERNTQGNITRAKTIRHKGALIDAVYSSSTGGKTRSAKSVWGYDHAYLQSREDSWALNPKTGNPNSSWIRSVSQAQARAGFGLSNIVDIKLTLNSDLSIASATATNSDDKTSTISGSKLRSLIGAKAAWVKKVTAIGGSKVPDSQPEPAPTPEQKPEATPKPDTDVTLHNTAKNVKYQTTENLNLRSTPVIGQVKKTIKKGATVTTTGQAANKSTWLHINDGKTSGWASAAYLKKVPTQNAKPPAATTQKVTTHTLTENLNLRQKPVNGKIIATMKKNTTVKPTGKSSHGGKWIEVKQGSKTGWAAKSYIKTITKKVTAGAGSTASKDGVTKVTKKTTAKLNLRAGAGTKHKSLVLVPKGAKVTQEASPKNGWTKITYKNKTGFASSKYLK